MSKRRREMSSRGVSRGQAEDVQRGALNGCLFDSSTIGQLHHQLQHPHDAKAPTIRSSNPNLHLAASSHEAALILASAVIFHEKGRQRHLGGERSGTSLKRNTSR